MNKDNFKKSWVKLVRSFRDLLSMSESNRRILAGITKILIEKEILTAGDVIEIEKEVKNSIKNKRRNKNV